MTDELHVDLLKVDPLSALPPKFLRRLALDDPLVRQATDATYAAVSEPHSMEECPHVG